MTTRRVRHMALMTMASVAALAPATGAFARPASRAQDSGRAYNVPAGSATDALNSFAAQAGIQLLYPYDVIATLRSPGLHGTYRRREALKRLIDGLPLVITSDNGHTVTLGVRRRPRQGSSARATDASQTAIDKRDILVVGTRFQNRVEIANKRQSRTVVDTLTQDDTGDLADQSMAEALRRVPGISTIYDEDEGSLVTIRGIQPDWNYLTVDGLAIQPVGTGGAGRRQVDMALIPSQSSRTTQVFKTFTPDLDAAAVGGVINIVPRSAYDRKKTQLLVDIYGNYFTYDEVPSQNSFENPKKSPVGGGFNATYASQFGASDQFGIVFTAGYQSKQRDQSKPSTPTRAYFTDDGQPTTVDSPDWHGIAAPDGFVSYSLTNRLRNYGGSLRLEFKPSENFYNSLMLFGYDQDESETRNTNNLIGLDRPANITATTGDYRVHEVRVAYRFHTYDRGTRGVQFHSRYQPDTKSSIDFAAGYSHAYYRDSMPDIAYTYAPNTLLHYDVSHFTPTFTLDNPENYADPSHYTLKNATLTNEDTQGGTFETKLDYSYNAGIEDHGFGFRTGIDWRRLHLDRDNTYTNYISDKSPMTNVAFPTKFVPLAWPGPVVWLDGQKFWNDVRPFLGVNDATSAADSAAEDFSYRETITAGYLEALFSTDRLHVVTGLRYDKTDFQGTFRQTLDGVLLPGFGSSKGSYENFLPSVNASFDATRKLRFKAAYSRTIGRPNPRDVASAEVRDDEDLTITRGNPDIRPRKADNYDLSLEQYFNGKNGLVSIAAFDKEVTDDIFTQRTQLVIDGATYSVRQPINAQNSSLRGIEFSLIDNRIRLPGLGDKFGVSFNATRLWGQMTIPVKDGERTINHQPYQMDWAGNLAVYYSLPKGGEIRLAANYQSAYLDTLGDTPDLDEGWRPFLTFDLSVRHRVTDHLLLKAQVRNLTNANRIAVFGKDLRYRLSDLEFGQSYYLDLIFKL